MERSRQLRTITLMVISRFTVFVLTNGIGCATNNELILKRLSSLEERVTFLENSNRQFLKTNEELTEELIKLKSTVVKLRQNEMRTEMLPVVKIVPSEELPMVEDNVNTTGPPQIDTEESSIELKLVGDDPYGVMVSKKTNMSDGVKEDVKRRTHYNVNLPQIRVEETLPVALLPNEEREEIKAKNNNNVTQLLEKAKDYFQNSDYDRCISTVDQFIKSNPNPELLGEGYYYKARAIFAKGDLLQAIGEFERFLRKFPSHYRFPDVLWYIGEAYRMLGDEIEAKRFFKMVVFKFPTSSAAKRAMVYLKESGGGQK